MILICNSEFSGSSAGRRIGNTPFQVFIFPRIAYTITHKEGRRQHSWWFMKAAGCPEEGVKQKYGR
jgi:hypothetical protein